MSIPEVNVLKRFLAAIIGSKKIVATLATIIFVFVKPHLDKIGIEVTEAELGTVTNAMIVLVIGMGVADMGKGKAQFEAQQAQRAVAPVAASSSPPVPASLPPEEKS